MSPPFRAGLIRFGPHFKRSRRPTRARKLGHDRTSPLRTSTPFPPAGHPGSGSSPTPPASRRGTSIKYSAEHIGVIIRQTCVQVD